MVDISDEAAIQVCGAHDGESDEDVLLQVIGRNGEEFLAGGEPSDSLVTRALRAAPGLLTCPVRAFIPVFCLPFAVAIRVAQGAARTAMVVVQRQISSPRQ